MSQQINKLSAVLFSVVRSLTWFNKILSNRATWNEVVICNRQAVSCSNVIAGPTARYISEMLGSACRRSFMHCATRNSWHESPFYRVIRNDCQGFNNLSYTIHLRLEYMYFLFNRTTLQVFVTYLTGALYMNPLWFYKHQHDNQVRYKLFVSCQRWWFQWLFWFVPSVPGYLREEEEHKPDPWRNPIERNHMGFHLEKEEAVVKTPTIISNNPVFRYPLVSEFPLFVFPPPCILYFSFNCSSEFLFLHNYLVYF